MPLAPGTRINHYEIVASLGAQAFGQNLTIPNYWLPSLAGPR